MGSWRIDTLGDTIRNLVLRGGDVYRLVEFYYPYGTGTPKRYARRAITIESVSYTARILEIGNEREAIAQWDDKPIPTVDIVIDDSTRFGEDRISDQFLVNDPEGCIVALYTWINGNTPTLEDRIVDGLYYVMDYEKTDQHSVTVRCAGIMGGIQAKTAGRVLRQPVTQEEIAATSSYLIPEIARGKIVPLVFGWCRSMELMPFTGGAETTLEKRLAAETGAGGLIYLADASEFNTAGRVQIGDEQIDYDLRDAINHTVRISSRPNPEEHAADALVAEVPRFRRGGSDNYGWIYLIADHTVGAVTNLRVNGKPISAAEWSLVARDDGSPIYYDGRAVVAAYFPRLPRISAAAHNVLNARRVDGQEYEDAWSVATGNTADEPLWAVDPDPAVPAGLIVGADLNAFLRVAFDGDLSDGVNVFGDIRRVFFGVTYAGNQRWDDDASKYVAMRTTKADLAFDPYWTPAEGDATRLSAPQQEDFVIELPGHEHEIISNTGPASTFASTTDLFKSGATFAYGLDQYGFSGIVNPDVIRKPKSFSGSVFTNTGRSDWFMHCNLYPLGNYGNMTDGDQIGSFMETIDVTQAVTYPDFWQDQVVQIATIADAMWLKAAGPTNAPDVLYDMIRIQVTGRGGIYDNGQNGRIASIGMAIYAGSKGINQSYFTMGQNAFNTGTITWQGTFTQADIDLLRVGVWPYAVARYAGTDDGTRGVVISDVKVWVRRKEEAVWDLPGADVPIVTESSSLPVSLQGVKLSSQLEKRIDITAQVSEWAEARGKDMWEYFSSEGGAPIMGVHACNQADGLKIAIYDMFWQIEYSPRISFNESVSVTADVDGLTDASGAVVRNPADLSQAILTGVSASGFDGLGIPESSIELTVYVWTRAALAAAGYEFGRAIYDQIKYSDMLYEIAREARCYFGMELGKFVLFIDDGRYEGGGNILTADEHIYSEQIPIVRSDAADLINRLLLHSDRIYQVSSGAGGAEAYRRTKLFEDAASQARAWGIHEREISLLWHNDARGGQGGTEDFGRYLLQRYSGRRNIGSLEAGLELLQYRLGDVVTLYHPNAGFNYQPVRILGRERTYDHRIKINFEYQALGGTVIWEDYHGADRSWITLGLGRTVMYFYIDGYLIAKLDMDGNLFLSGEMEEEFAGVAAVTGDDAIFLYHPQIRFATVHELAYAARVYLKLTGQDAQGLGIGNLVSYEVIENYNMTGKAMSGGGYYEADLEEFRLSFNGVDVVMAIDAQGRVAIGGQVYENWQF